MTDRYCMRAFSELRCRRRSPASVAGPHGPLHDESKDRVRDAVDMVELVSARTELRRAGPTRYEGLCPFHEERTPSFGINPAQKVYYCFGCQASGDVFTFVQETEGVDFKGALELLADRYGVELELEAEDPRDGRAAPAPRAPARAARAHGGLLRAPAVGVHARPSARASTSRSAGLEEETLREFRVGYAPSAWDRVLLASRRGGLHRARSSTTPGSRSARKQNGQLVRPLPRADHVPARRHPRARARLRRARDARGPAAEVPQHPDNDDLPQGPAPVRRRPRARARRAGGRGDPVRGLHRRRSRCTRRACATRRAHGHGADRRAGRRAGAAGAGRCCSRSTPTARAGGDAAGAPSARREAQARAARRAAAGRAGSGRARPARRAPRRCSALVERVRAVRALPRRAGAGRRRPREPGGPRPDRSTSCARCSRRSRRARCAWS